MKIPSPEIKISFQSLVKLPESSPPSRPARSETTCAASNKIMVALDSLTMAKVKGWKEGSPMVPTTALTPKITCALMSAEYTKNFFGVVTSVETCFILTLTTSIGQGY
mmetsp:Transcript_11314/g.14269  ORF Transcript_11314/g.14269 Transcript_11314/m.14269 type:complete len:108 (-) Transcript_11314:107-430(-)